jgi:hypothetical protein
MKETQNKSCPSSMGQVGSTILGVVNPSGTIGFFEDAVEVTTEFLQEAGDLENIEKRFRFSNKCVQSGCKQWTGKECGVIKTVLALEGIPANSELPNCNIRANCRWFFQEGAKACNGCRYVITNTAQVEEDI